jgi:hypothetical protein
MVKSRRRFPFDQAGGRIADTHIEIKNIDAPSAFGQACPGEGTTYVLELLLHA